MTTSRRPLAAANWKMNGDRASIKSLLDGLKQGLPDRGGAEVLVCAPAVYLPLVAAELADSAIAWGAQTVSEHGDGAYTGEISVNMLQDYGCRYVIIGHSERRSLFGETDPVVADKFRHAVENGLQAVLCLGEQPAERDAGVTANVLQEQLQAVIQCAGIAAFANAVIAYEPVWAIGTGRTATPEQAQEAHGIIRAHLARHDEQTAAAVRILYGGSVKAANAAQLFSMNDVDGGLVGGASLQVDEFLAICRAAR